MQQLMNSLTPEEKEVFEDEFQLKKVLQHPLVKLMVVHKPKAILNFNIEGLNEPKSEILHLDGNRDIKINSFVQQLFQ